MTEPAKESDDTSRDDHAEPTPDEKDAHDRPGSPDLPFGDDPQENQGDDPASGGS